MKRMLSGRQRGALFACIVLLAAVAGHPVARAASIWERADPFQACLETRFEQWANAGAELIVNEDPNAGRIDDAAVAQWTVATLDACRSQTGGGGQASVERFTKHMAHWRKHIYDLAQSIRQGTQSD